MPLALTQLADLATLPFDEIIDVRSPAEFAEDHMPGAINLPALSNEERARVGTIYVQEDPFKARKIGAALVSRNMAAHLEGPLADREGCYKPLVYCWRGGQRSGSVAIILKQIGWRADTVEGGYQAYRRLVSKALYDGTMPCPVVVIDGGTGTAKTRLLHHLADQGAQTLDLEAMAAHRGSLFGPVSDSQPSQKAFESQLAMGIAALAPDRPVYVEAESSKIGRLIIPPALWQAMIAAPNLRLTAPLEARVSHLMSAYPDLLADSAKLADVLAQLTRYHGHDTVAQWQALAQTRDFAPLIRALVQTHYDPRYARISRAHAPAAEEHALPDLSENTLAATAAKLIAAE
ncbi:tRNA 2-selenouridine(34) synthase MnmH [Shimia sp. MMG029]|uniref:tRNA 2-selenouridine(34) synthase MnmH n=1 Tax=Shimia sp. MMG029 TaxID=3021978 RepID=UPI0022FE2812|nr:tRNA 2-selenouridine(34) synthase MnmH [Shimia sp. MMG029]MDA5555742.1 tRNA 2-selenouridine(34) synthase MnmH [Shimia sp. MMG029]